jgi:desulfoferrodoxin-like iron-binding protein
MADKHVSDIYTCPKCKQEVIIIKVGKGELQCCGEKMKIVDPEHDYEYSEEDEEAEE